MVLAFQKIKIYYPFIFKFIRLYREKIQDEKNLLILRFKSV